MSQTTPSLSPDVSIVVSRDNESAYTLAAGTIVDLAMSRYLNATMAIAAAMH